MCNICQYSSLLNMFFRSAKIVVTFLKQQNNVLAASQSAVEALNGNKAEKEKHPICLPTQWIIHKQMFIFLFRQSCKQKEDLEYDWWKTKEKQEMQAIDDDPPPLSKAFYQCF